MNEYQIEADKTAVYPKDTYDGLFYVTMGLTGEAGEIANKVKKFIRDGRLDREDLMDELGDVMWYTAMLALELGYNLDAVAKHNVAKLKSRAKRGVIKGKGDKR
jgi:NTP pyrophosphatase (non-canonical NTP hydrolase)